ncbi:MAG: DUF357 domain-containing protein [Nanoarchaeota archaeon]
MAIPSRSIDESELDRAFAVTRAALDKAKISKPLSDEESKRAAVMLDMASRYFNDASFFRSNGDLLNAFGAVYYAHGWLDAGARIGLFDVGCDSKLFTVD